MSYTLLKDLHVTCVILSGTGFFLRGILMLTSAPVLESRWVRVAPHVIDTILLASAIVLAITIKQYPFVHAWMTAKLLGLLAYIGLGMFALRRGRSKAARTAFWLGSLAAFSYIASVALTKQASGIIGLF